jgi:hypothetical protein
MIFVTEKDKLVILAGALKAREEEVMQYQINIDNYRLAIEEIRSTYPDGATETELNSGPGSAATYEDMKRINAILFSMKLGQLLIENELEQDKSKIILNVIRRQLEGQDIKSLVPASLT